jgi:hypothetical protein
VPQRQFKATDSFWKSYRGLTPQQKEAADEAFKIFCQDPWDARLRTHKIHSLSARYRTTIWSAVILADLRAVFYADGDTIISVDIGTHAIYK